jgi:signal peptidase I
MADAPRVSFVQRTAPPSHHQTLLQAFQSLIYIIIIALFIITFTVQPFRIPSESMEPTLLVGDFLLVNKQVGLEPGPRFFAPISQVHRGDMIVFRYPVDPTLHLVKRVVAVPGDRLRLREGRVILNGSAVSEPYAVFRPAGTDAYRDGFPRLTSADPSIDSRWWVQMRSLVSHGELTVPPGSYFVLGDNRNDSDDSRYWGFVPAANIVGKPLLIYFSLSNGVPTPGQSNASALPAGANAADDSSSANDGNFARWGRALHIPR